MKRINLYFILFTAFILITTTIYSILITSTTFTPEESQFIESIPVAQPLPMFIVIAGILFILLIIEEQWQMFSPTKFQVNAKGPTDAIKKWIQKKGRDDKEWIRETSKDIKYMTTDGDIKVYEIIDQYVIQVIKVV